MWGFTRFGASLGVAVAIGAGVNGPAQLRAAVAWPWRGRDIAAGRRGASVAAGQCRGRGANTQSQ